MASMDNKISGLRIIRVNRTTSVQENKFKKVQVKQLNILIIWVTLKSIIQKGQEVRVQWQTSVIRRM